MFKRNDIIIVLAALVITFWLGYPNDDLQENNFDITQHESHQSQTEASLTNIEPTSHVFDEEDQTLMNKIKELAKNKEIAPIDARIDPVWKAIPGYNGLEVDVEQTYKNSRDSENIEWVYREVKPRIMLEDLGAQPIYRGNPKKEIVALMINVAWGNEYIPTMLEVLREENVKATFFLDGSWLSKNADLAKQIVTEGHELGNHAYSHRNMSQLSRKEATDEIAKTERLLKEKLGVTSRFFAPPSGDYDQETVQAAYDLGLNTVLWTLDTVDWKKPSPSTIIQKVSARVEAGSLILMHPTKPTSEALAQVIQNIKNKGLVLGTVEEVLSSNRLQKVESALYFD